MKSTLLSVLSLLALFTACSTDLEIQKTAQEGKDINEVIVTVENRNSYDVDLAQTRTVYTNIGGKNQFVWDASDMIGIFPDEGNQVGFSMKDGAGQTSAKFTGGGWGLKTSSKYAAYYPLIHDFDLDRTQIPLDFTGQVQTGNGTTAHLGAYDYMAAPAAEPLGNTVNFAFKGLSTLIHLKITMPKAGTYKKVYLETDGKFITKGKLNLEEDSFTATETSNVVELNFNDLTIESEGGLLDTYMMIAPVDLSENTLTAIVVDESGTEYKSVLAGKDFKGGAIWNYSRDGIRNEGGGSSSGIYLGVMGFNQQVYSSSISKLDKENKSGFESFIDDLNMKYGTLLYYSVDQAINTMQSATFPSDLSTVAIVTFTDGLDQGSMMMEDSYDNDNDYLNAINQRIKNEKINGLSLTAYSIGLRGQDVSDVTQFKSNLSKLASSAENATEVTSMSEVNAKFKEIAEQLTQSSYVQTVNLKMPGVSNGILVRFTFDNVSSAKNSSLYIEGTFNRSTLSLENVKYVGLSSTSGTTIKGVRDGIFVNFTFDGVHTNNNTLIDKNFTDEWTYITSNSSWQINSEFDKSEDSDVVVKRSSAAIMLVLDCSSSLASDFGKAKSNAKDFINTLYEAITVPDVGEHNEAIIGEHEYVDLGLSVKWATCNVGANSPEDYGGYYAWGETSTKSNYSWSNIFDCLDNSGYSWSVYKIGGKTKIEPDSGHDTARENWGYSWRMPTIAELKELNDKCTWKWTTKGGHNGFVVTGPNGNSIFLPAAGYRDDTSSHNVGEGGYYWSSTLSSSYSIGAQYLYFCSSNHFTYNYYRSLGFSVRPVTE